MRRFMSFAAPSKVQTLRAILLQYGATETAEDEQRWCLRKKADAVDAEWAAQFSRDDLVSDSIM